MKNKTIGWLTGLIIAIFMNCLLDFWLSLNNTETFIIGMINGTIFCALGMFVGNLFPNKQLHWTRENAAPVIRTRGEKQ